MNDYGPRYTNADERERTQHGPHAKDLAQCHHALWKFRKRAAAWWPTPNRDDALRFAVTEAGEALDAWLRANRPQYARNRDRLNGEEAVLEELTDCVMMLLTAVAQPIQRIDNGESIDIDDVFAWVSETSYNLINEWHSGEIDTQVSECLYGIQSYPGMFPILPRLKARLARIEAKHKPTEHGAMSVYEIPDTSADPTGIWMSEADDG